MADATTTPTSGTDWGAILSSLFSGYNAITGSAGKDATTAANRADPWGPQRGQYQDQLNAFMKDPGASTFSDPAFQAARNQGLEGVARTMGASGMGNSGNTQAALYKYGDTFAYDAEQTKYKQLADLAGVNAGSPAAAGAILAQGSNNQNANTAAGLTGVGSIISALTAAGIPQTLATQIANAFGGGGGGGSLNPDGTINWGSTGTGSGDLGGFVGGDGTYTPDPTTVPIDFSTPPPVDTSGGINFGDIFSGFAGGP